MVRGGNIQCTVKFFGEFKWHGVEVAFRYLVWYPGRLQYSAAYFHSTVLNVLLLYSKHSRRTCSAFYLFDLISDLCICQQWILSILCLCIQNDFGFELNGSNYGMSRGPKIKWTEYKCTEWEWKGWHKNAMERNIENQVKHFLGFNVVTHSNLDNNSYNFTIEFLCTFLFLVRLFLLPCKQYHFHVGYF